jgi:hypothetical protein
MIMQDPRGYEVQNCFLTIDDQCVAGVVSTLKSSNRGNFFGEQINYLALTFVPPVSAYNNYVLTHNASLAILLISVRKLQAVPLVS